MPIKGIGNVSVEVKKHPIEGFCVVARLQYRKVKPAGAGDEQVLTLMLPCRNEEGAKRTEKNLTEWLSMALQPRVAVMHAEESKSEDAIPLAPRRKKGKRPELVTA